MSRRDRGGDGSPTGWVDRSIRTKGLVVIAVPIAILVVVLGTTFWFTHVDDRAQNVAGRARQVVDARHHGGEQPPERPDDDATTTSLTGDAIGPAVLRPGPRSRGARPARAS